MSFISCQGVSFAYEGRLAVCDLNFSVSIGDYLCIVGDNGAGKSTLVKGLLGLLSPASGKIVYGDGLRATDIGYLPQQTLAMRDFPASVYEVVLSGRLGQCGLRPFYSSEDKACVRANLDFLEMWSFRDRSYRELSGGQQRKVMLARALCATQRLLLLDEPTESLDSVSTQDFYSCLQELHKMRGVTVVMVSHDMDRAFNYASTVLHLKTRQLFYGELSDYRVSSVGRQFLGLAE